MTVNMELFVLSIMKEFCFCCNRPEWTPELNTYRVEAAWKLAQWDSLENYLAAGCCLDQR